MPELHEAIKEIGQRIENSYSFDDIWNTILPESIDYGLMEKADNIYVIPNTFDIMYMYNGQENEYLHKISTCVLQDFTVKYGGQKFETFRGTAEVAPVVETEISKERSNTNELQKK